MTRAQPFLAGSLKLRAHQYWAHQGGQLAFLPGLGGLLKDEVRVPAKGLPVLAVALPGPQEGAAAGEGLPALALVGSLAHVALPMYREVELGLMVLPHWGQMYSFLPVCTPCCTMRLEPWLQPYHTCHGYRVSPMCTLRCQIRWSCK